MLTEKIDLYDFYKIQRNGARGGFLTVYARTESAETKRRVRPAMLIMAGGGYNMLSDRESEPIALKYLSAGFASFVLSYSVKTAYPAPLTEAMLAVRYIRENSAKYSVHKNKVCVIGFSAGGHLAGLLATAKGEEVALSGCDAEQVRPDAVIFSYPVVTMGDKTHCDTHRNVTGGDSSLNDKLSVEKRVDGNAVPAFMWHTFEDDCVPVENSLMLAGAYSLAGVPFSLHIFEKGGHGLSTADEETCDLFPCQVSEWFKLSVEWLAVRGIKMQIC